MKIKYDYQRVSLTTNSGIPLALSNKFQDVQELTNQIEQASSASDLAWRVFKETKNYLKSVAIYADKEDRTILLLTANMCNNQSYLIVYKKPKPVKSEKVAEAKEIIDNIVDFHNKNLTKTQFYELQKARDFLNDFLKERSK